MKERLDIIKEKYDFLNNELLKPEVYNDYKKMQSILKEKNSIEKTVQAYDEYTQVLDDIDKQGSILRTTRFGNQRQSK